MPLIIAAPRLERWKRASTRRVGEYRVFAVDQHAMLDPGGNAARDVFTFSCPDWCNVVAVTDDGELILIWQYRHGVDALSLEIPGGVIDEGESAEAAARRELREETGYEARSWEPLLFTHPNPALQGNRCFAFLATGAHLAGKAAFDENEECEVVRMPATSAATLVAEGHVTHALVVSALQAFALRAAR